MEKTLQVLNSLETNGVLGRYAIGGAMGATFYVEPFLTFDLDVFVISPQQGPLLTLTKLYEALREKGYCEKGGHVNIEGVPVQFLPAYNLLLEEALTEARTTTYETTSTRVLRAEHLIAICLQTGRDKDIDRIRLFTKEASFDMEYLMGILRRHELEDAWQHLNK